MVAAIAGWIAMGAALAGAVYALTAAFALGAFFKRSVPQAPEFPPVTLLKPLHGAEPGLLENLESFATQGYPARIQIIFGVHGQDDAAIAAVNGLKARHPELDIALVVGGGPDCANPKIGNLIAMVPSVKHSVLVLSDSDISVAPNYLRQVVSALAELGVGAVSCCYTGRALNNPWSNLSAMGINYQFLPGVVLGLALGLAKPCFGSTIALKSSVLTEIGGFESFRDLLADDYEIGQAVRARGYRVAFSPLAVAHTCAEEGLSALLRHELRWARTVRMVDGVGHAGSVITHAVPLALLGAVCLGFSWASVVTLALTLASRLYLKWRIDRIFGRSGGPVWLLPARDMLSFAAFVGSFFAERVDWRGHPYRVQPDGILARE
jgi:ceramide glucosyltransferase